MYNLFIGYAGPNDTENTIEVSASRFLESTDKETQMRFRDLTGDAAATIKEYPALFMREGYRDGAFVGHITSIVPVWRDYKITFERDESIGIISPDNIDKMALELNIDAFEFSRTHWAVKQNDLLKTLKRNNISSENISSKEEIQPINIPSTDGSQFNKNQVFIVHGHNEHAKNDTKDYVESRGLEPIILHQQASEGRTIIEKIDHYSNVGFGIVLYSECDIGAKRDTLDFKWRARQNVVFEHGYLIAKLGRPNVTALLKGSVETPNDMSGVVYAVMDPGGLWKQQMDDELIAAGYKIKIEE